MSLVKSVMTSNISGVMAFAIVLLAAGSVASITNLASVEIGSTLNILPVVHVAEAKSSEQVLGDSTIVPAAAIIDDSALEAGSVAPAVKLSGKAVSFDSTAGRWDYTISYSGLDSSSGTGSVTVGTYVVASGLTAASGKVDTGAILKPSMSYHITFWVTDSSGNQAAVANLAIKTPKGSGSTSTGNFSIVSPCLNGGQGQNGSSTPPSVPPQGNGTSTLPSMFCIKTDSGKMICPRPPVCGQMTQGGHMGSPSSTPPGMWPGSGSNGSSTPPWGNPPQSGSPSGNSTGNLSPPPRH
jgi:hypothetical protein